MGDLGEKTRDFCLNGDFAKRKHVIFGLNGGFTKTRDFRLNGGFSKRKHVFFACIGDLRRENT